MGERTEFGVKKKKKRNKNGWVPILALPLISRKLWAHCWSALKKLQCGVSNSCSHPTREKYYQSPLARSCCEGQQQLAANTLLLIFSSNKFVSAHNCARGWNRSGEHEKENHQPPGVYMLVGARQTIHELIFEVITNGDLCYKGMKPADMTDTEQSGRSM